MTSSNAFNAWRHNIAIEATSLFYLETCQNLWETNRTNAGYMYILNFCEKSKFGLAQIIKIARNQEIVAINFLYFVIEKFVTFISTMCQLRKWYPDQRLKFIHCGLRTPYMASYALVTIGLANSLLPDSTKPLPEPVLTEPSVIDPGSYVHDILCKMQIFLFKQMYLKMSASLRVWLFQHHLGALMSNVI